MPETPDDDETYFQELLDKKGGEWLKKQLEALGFKATAPNPETPEAPKAPGDFAAFLNGELQNERKEKQTLRDRLEKVLDLLTPEQRQTLRDAGAPPSPTPKRPSEQPEKRRFLKNL